MALYRSLTVLTVAAFAAGCSANARFDLSEFQQTETTRTAKSSTTASTYGQGTASAPYPYSQPNTTAYQPSAASYQAAPQSYGSYSATETASVGRAASVDTLVHVVREGDTLFRIAQRYNVSVYELYRANNLSSDRLAPGQELLVPRRGQPYQTGGRYAAR